MRRLSVKLIVLIIVGKTANPKKDYMFEELLETEPNAVKVKGRRVYFAGSAAVIGIFLISAFIVSIFAYDFDLGMGDVDVVELITPLDVQPDMHPELNQAPKQAQKLQAPGGSSGPQQTKVALTDESPQAVPSTASTKPTSSAARPAGDYVEVSGSDSDSAGIGSGRGIGTGIGDGISDGIGNGTVAASTEPVPPPPPPAPKAPVTEKPVVLSMGVVNSRAMSLPLPIIPAAAKAANVTGTVNVQILVDETGKVVSASAVSGSPLLRTATEAAARNARFTPTFLSGKPIKITGVIHYEFS